MSTPAIDAAGTGGSAQVYPWFRAFNQWTQAQVIKRPRLHWAWLMPLLMWVSPLGMVVHTWQVLVSWGTGGLMIHALVRREPA